MDENLKTTTIRKFHSYAKTTNVSFTLNRINNFRINSFLLKVIPKFNCPCSRAQSISNFLTFKD